MRRAFLLLIALVSFVTAGCDEARNIAAPVVNTEERPITQIYGENFNVFSHVDGTISISSKYNDDTENYINIVIEPKGPSEGEFGFSVALYEMPEPGTSLGLLAVGAPGENVVYVYQLLTWSFKGANAHLVDKIHGREFGDDGRFGHSVMYKQGYLLILTGNGEIDKSIPVEEFLPVG